MAYVLQELGDELLRRSMRQGAEHDVHPVGYSGLGRGKTKAGVGGRQCWMHVGDGHSFVRTGRCGDHLEVRVRAQEPQ